MKPEKRSSVPSFAVPVFFALFLVSLTLLLLLEPWLRRHGLGGLSWPVLLVVYIAIVAFILKQALLRSMARGFVLEPMTPGQFAQAESCGEAPAEPLPAPPGRTAEQRQPDAARIEELTHELLALGFSQCREGRLQVVGVSGQAVYVRLFEHPAGSLAILSQAFASGAALPVSCTVQCAFADDWAWADTTVQRNWIHFMMRRPRALGAVHPAGAAVAELWTSCRQKSEKLRRELQVQQLPLLANEYEAHLVHALPALKAALRRKNIVVGIFEGIFIMPRTTEWWGEYARYAGRQES